MAKRIPGRSSLLFLILSLLVVFCCGCETWKGMKRDFETIAGWDKDFQEALW